MQIDCMERVQLIGVREVVSLLILVHLLQANGTSQWRGQLPGVSAVLHPVQRHQSLQHMLILRSAHPHPLW